MRAGQVPGKVERVRGRGSGPLRKNSHPPAAGGYRTAPSRDRGSGVLIGISAPMLARCGSGVNRPGVSGDNGHTVGGHPTGDDPSGTG